MARTRKSRKSNAVKVDFTGVESSGKLEAGRQLLTVDGTPEMKTSENSGNDYINWKMKGKGGSVYHTTSLQPQALWNLRNLLEALGMEVPEGPIDLDLDDFDGMELGAEIDHETYQGKKKPVIVDLFPVDELDGEEDDGDEEEEDEEEGSEEEELTYDDVMEMDKEELLELAEEEDIKVLAKQKRKLETLREHIASELGLEAGEEEDDEEDEEEEPAKPTRKSRRKTGTKEVKKGSSVTFEDDGEEMEGQVKSINQKEGFAVIDVDGEEWEVELEDIQVK